MHAQRAAQLHNMNQVEAANKQVEDGITALTRMVAMEPEEAQGYITGGTFYLNIHRFEEALNMWQLAQVNHDI